MTKKELADLAELVALENDQEPTLRDRFAMAALTGLIANKDCPADPPRIADDAYRMADLMLAARRPAEEAK